MASISSHRMIYVIKNRKKQSLKKIMILPYLHERKIYLFKTKPKIDYFYTLFNEWKDVSKETENEHY